MRVYILGMVIFGRKRIIALEERIARLEESAAKARAISSLEELARDMIASVPGYLNETTGEIDNKRRIREAFDAAREWVKQREQA